MRGADGGAAGRHPSDSHYWAPTRQIVDDAGDGGAVVLGELLESAERGFDGQSSIRPRSKSFSQGSEHTSI